MTDAKWIAVSDRLPLNDGQYLCATWLHMDMTQHVEVASYRGGAGTFSEASVTHWMPLPQPPQGDKT